MPDASSRLQDGDCSLIVIVAGGSSDLRNFNPRLRGRCAGMVADRIDVDARRRPSAAMTRWPSRCSGIPSVSRVMGMAVELILLVLAVACFRPPAAAVPASGSRHRVSWSVWPIALHRSARLARDQPGRADDAPRTVIAVVIILAAFLSTRSPCAARPRCDMSPRPIPA